jgi:hypothetical protein
LSQPKITPLGAHALSSIIWDKMYGITGDSQKISLMKYEMGIFHYCHVGNNEKSRVTVTCLQFRSRTVSGTTPHTPWDPMYAKYVTPGLGLIITRICTCNSTVCVL